MIRECLPLNLLGGPLSTAQRAVLFLLLKRLFLTRVRSEGLGVEGGSVQAVLAQEDQVVPNGRNLKFLRRVKVPSEDVLTQTTRGQSTS